MAQCHLGALGLVLNAAVGGVRARPVEERKHDVLDEDVARFSPLKHADLNVLGRYSFRASTSVDGGVRPLRDPSAPELDEDDDDGGQE